MALTPEEQAHLDELDRRIEAGETWKPEIEPVKPGESFHIAPVKDHAVKHTDGTPISRSLPRRKGGKLETLDGHAVKKHKDGGYTDLQGRPIVRNKTERDREIKRTGFVDSDD